MFFRTCCLAQRCMCAGIARTNASAPRSSSLVHISPDAHRRTRFAGDIPNRHTRALCTALRRHRSKEALDRDLQTDATRTHSLVPRNTQTKRSTSSKMGGGPRPERKSYDCSSEEKEEEGNKVLLERLETVLVRVSELHARLEAIARDDSVDDAEARRAADRAADLRSVAPCDDVETIRSFVRSFRPVLLARACAEFTAIDARILSAESDSELFCAIHTMDALVLLSSARRAMKLFTASRSLRLKDDVQIILGASKTDMEPGGLSESGVETRLRKMLERVGLPTN